MISISNLCKLNYLVDFDNKHVFIKLNYRFIYLGSLVYQKKSQNKKLEEQLLEDKVLKKIKEIEDIFQKKKLF